MNTANGMAEDGDAITLWNHSAIVDPTSLIRLGFLSHHKARRVGLTLIICAASEFD